MSTATVGVLLRSIGATRGQVLRDLRLPTSGQIFRFHRVEYDFRATQRKLRAIPQLDQRLAERLGEGA